MTERYLSLVWRGCTNGLKNIQIHLVTLSTRGQYPFKESIIVTGCIEKIQ